MSAVAPIESEGSFYMPVRGASALAKQPWERFVDLRNVQAFHLRNERQKLEQIAALPENWDGNGSAKPDEFAIARALDLMPLLYEAVSTTGRRWFPPHITASEAGEIVLEWWHNERKITVYISAHGLQYIKVWGIDIDNEMEVAEIAAPHAFGGVWSWLFS